MSEALESTDFRPHLHSTFLIDLTDGRSLPLELIQVKNLTGGDPNPTRVPFSLLFCTFGEFSYLPQRIYQLAHEHLGTLEIFLVPVGPDENGMRYEAIFN